VCHKCRKGSLRLKIHEKRMGFASKLLLECSNSYCTHGGVRTDSEGPTSRKLSAGEKGPFEINRRMVLVAREIGVGHAALQKLVAMIGLAGGLSTESFTS
jgi:hypothetical protein